MSPQDPTPPAKRELSDEHKAALAVGRSQSRAVRKYLDALKADRPKPGRRRTPESIRKRLDQIDDEIGAAESLRQVQLVQKRKDLRSELKSLENKVDISDLEQGFIAAAVGYSERKGISYAAWREVGVSTAVLTEAGVKRGR